MKNQDLKWEILSKSKVKSQRLIVNVLLKNRGLKTKREKEEFIKPKEVTKLTPRKLEISKTQIEQAIKRIKKAIEKQEQIIIYGDYDADGICATAILWKSLYKLTNNVLPYLPDRFTEGYGINPDSINKIKKEYSRTSLIITVDNGIVANDAVNIANKLGIDVIITDHHVAGKNLPKAHSMIHTTKLCGAGIAWILTREIRKSMVNSQWSMVSDLELAAIGTISDQVPLLGVNRSIVKYGLEALNKTKNPGLSSLINDAGLKRGSIGTYEVGFLIAPRLNAMGRLEHAIDSLRLLCARNKGKIDKLTQIMSKTNTRRQNILTDVVKHAKKLMGEKIPSNVIVLSHETYHEGVIGLAASKLVEEYYRPAIVFSKGKKISKASARSISGFNIIETLRMLKSISFNGGGHPMAAGFSLETEKIELFTQELEEISKPLLTEEILAKKLKIDLELNFAQITKNLYDKLSHFEPTGIGNPQPTFCTKKVSVLDARCVGKEAKHLKLRLEKDGQVFDSIAFNMGSFLMALTTNPLADIAYNIVENVWNGRCNLELKIRDIKVIEN